MASTSETGHAKNAANLQSLIASVIGYGAAYNPSKASLKLPALQVLDTNCNNAVKAVNAAFPAYAQAIADKITLELHESTAPFNLIGTAFSANLLTTGYAQGLATLTLPESFYIVVKQRNSIETWSSVPVTPANGMVRYDFTQHTTSAYGNNMKPIGSYFGIYGGDANQDGVVEAMDMIAVDNFLAPGASGYIPEDTNGDGVIDAADMELIKGNSDLFIRKIVPE